MRSLSRTVLEALARRRPRYALQVSAPKLGVCGLRVRLSPTSPLYSAAGGEIVELPLDQVIAPVVLKRGAWQAEEIELIATYAPPQPSVLFDVGANIGLVTRQLLHRLPTIETAVCFEPHPDNFLYMKRNLEHLPRCVLVNAALGAKEDELTLYEDVHNAGNCSLNPGAIANANCRTTKIRCLPVSDDLLLERVPPALRDAPIVWKSDTQGYDETIMCRLSDDFWRRVHVCVFEILRIARPAYDPSRFAAILGRFPLRRFSDEPNTPVSVADILAYAEGDDGASRDLLVARAAT